MSTAHFAQLEAFLAVARAQSFSGAARELGVSRSAVSQSVRQLEEELRVTLVARTTRSVSLTDAGRRLLESAGPAVAQVHAALSGMAETPGEVVGRVRLTVPRSAFHFVIEPVLPEFRERHPRIEVELVFEDRRVDIVREGFDAGIRLSEFVERDMVSLRLTNPLRFIVVGAPTTTNRNASVRRTLTMSRSTNSLKRMPASNPSRTMSTRRSSNTSSTSIRGWRSRNSGKTGSITK